MRFFLLSCLLVLLLPLASLAATDDFTIKLLVGDDTTPPTTPSLLSVVATAQTQIDVTWSVSVDNYLLGGYVLLRDGVAIATTSQTSFVDTGLTASTLYEYTVFAFDAAGNVSATSSPVSTTTLAIPVVATSTPVIENTSEATKTIRMTDFAVMTEAQKAVVTWVTNRPTRYALRWGRTDLYDGGYVVNDVYQINHETSITELEPGTTYQYELTAYSPEGAAIILRTGQFTTAVSDRTDMVANVTEVALQPREDGVVISFTWPLMEEGMRVRIVRNHLGYPNDMFDGAIVYEGTAQEFFDREAFSLSLEQYYTIFVIRADGAISSGAVARIRQSRPVDDAATGATTTPTSTPTLPDMPLFGLDTNNIQLSQFGATQTFLDTDLTLSYKDSFTIKIPKDALPDHLKSIVVTLLDPTNQHKRYSFLLRLNRDQTAYEAVIAPLYVRGVSRLEIEIYDFERMLVGRYRKQVTFIVTHDEETLVIFPDVLLTSLRTTIPTMSGFLALLLVVFFFWWKRGKTAEDKH